MSTQQRIFAASKKVFEREGLDGLSIRIVAKDVGITPMAIYRHYTDKDALIDALTADALEAWRARVARIAAADPLKWLKAAMEAFLDFALEEPRTYEAAFELPARHARQFPDDFLAGRSPAVNMAFERVAEVKKQGLFDDTDATEIVITFWALAQGLISLYRANRFISEKEFRAVYATAMRRCLNSFMTVERAA